MKGDGQLYIVIYDALDGAIERPGNSEVVIELLQSPVCNLPLMLKLV